MPPLSARNGGRRNSLQCRARPPPANTIEHDGSSVPAKICLDNRGLTQQFVNHTPFLILHQPPSRPSTLPPGEKSHVSHHPLSRRCLSDRLCYDSESQ